jgi:uncharacterized protein (TIGR01777 family)
MSFGASPVEEVRRLAVTGASGLIGSALCPVLAAAGHEVWRLVRRPPVAGQQEARWSPDGRSDLSALEGLHGIVHLAGEGVAGGWWSAGRKRRIRESRVQGTRSLAEGLARLARPPRVLVSASAIGIYGDRGDQVLDESSAAGEGFLPEVVAGWEEAISPARAAGIRCVSLRLGMVLSPAGGALGRMLAPFRLGLGGRVGTGRQWVSWVAIDDVTGAIEHALSRPELQGPVNVVAPEPVTQAELARELGRALRRPTPFALPAWAARLALGEMAGPLLLESTRVRPARLLESGYAFRHPGLGGALRALLSRPGTAGGRSAGSAFH